MGQRHGRRVRAGEARNAEPRFDTEPRNGGQRPRGGRIETDEDRRVVRGEEGEGARVGGRRAGEQRDVDAFEDALFCSPDERRGAAGVDQGADLFLVGRDQPEIGRELRPEREPLEQLLADQRGRVDERDPAQERPRIRPSNQPSGPEAA